MPEYDVIVVGAGPAGSSAAKVTAEKGIRTIILEEHRAIGLPQHCSGMMHGTKSGLSKKILSVMDPRVTLSEIRVRRIYSPQGRFFDISLEGKGVYLIDRSLFDQHLAAEAAEAGAEIMLNTKVTGLISDGQQIQGVTTNRDDMPEIYGKVVIGADGVASLLSGGVPVWAGFSEKITDFQAGLNLEVYNAWNTDREILELHVGAFSASKRYMGWIWLQQNDGHTCHVAFCSLEDYERCRQGDSILSRKLKNAVVAKMTGWVQPLTVNPGPFAKKVKPGLIVAGAAANYPSFLLGSLSGSYAGEVAAMAVKEGDLSEESLARYDVLCRKIDNPGWWSSEYGFGAWRNLSEEEQEDLFDKMIKADHVNFDVYENL